MVIDVEVWRGYAVDRGAKHGHLKRLIVFLLSKLLPHDLGFCLTNLISDRHQIRLNVRLYGHLWFWQKVRILNRTL